MAGNGKLNANRSECSDIKKLISAYIDNETGAPENDAVVNHISECPSCRRELANMYAMREMIKNVYAPKEKVDFSASIMARVKTEKAPVKKSLISGSSIKHSVVRYGAVAAIVVVAFGFTALYSQNHTRKVLAEKRKFDTYVVEHSIQTADEASSSSQVIAVNFEK